MPAFFVFNYNELRCAGVIPVKDLDRISGCGCANGSQASLNTSKNQIVSETSVTRAVDVRLHAVNAAHAQTRKNPPTYSPKLPRIPTPYFYLIISLYFSFVNVLVLS